MQTHFLDKMAAALSSVGIRKALSQSIPNELRSFQLASQCENDSFIEAYRNMTPKERNSFRNWVNKVHAEKGDSWVREFLRDGK